MARVSNGKVSRDIVHGRSEDKVTGLLSANYTLTIKIIMYCLFLASISGT